MVIKLAEELGLYMALLPCWGSIVKEHILTMENVLTYAKFLTDRYKDYSNIIWVLGGDVKAEAYKDIYTTMGTYFKENMPDKLVTFHPFGRCSSTTWFADRDRRWGGCQESMRKKVKQRITARRVSDKRVANRVATRIAVL